MLISLNGRDLTLAQVAAVARQGAVCAISAHARQQVELARRYVDQKLEEGAVIYGLTTGFGKFSDTLIPQEEVGALQRNLIISHACGMGNPLPTDVVRAVMLLRCNALSRGHSGISMGTLDTLLEMLNRGVHPLIPEKGSLGASGDLAPLAHMVLVMLGEGQAEYQGEILPGAEAMKRASIPILTLAAKEGLALINGTQVMTAIGCLALWDGMHLAKTADIAAALTCEALNAITKAFDPRLHYLRGHPGQINTAQNMLTLLEGSGNCREVCPGKVQDAYSIRCIPQVHGAGRDALAYVWQAVEREINAVTDNPIIFPQEDDVISGGNFHGQPMALAFDFMGIALAEYANIAERRIERLVNPQLSGGLPAFLSSNGGVNSGFMILQYSAASMVSENKIYAHPASVDSIPSSAGQEDHVSMGTTSARTAAMILENSRRVVGLELFAASQALGFGNAQGLAPATKAVYDLIRTEVDFARTDIVMYPEMARFEEMIRRNRVLEAVEAICGPLL